MKIGNNLFQRIFNWVKKILTPTIQVEVNIFNIYTNNRKD